MSIDIELQDQFEAYVQQCLSHVDGYTFVWQSIGPSLETLAFLTLIHSEEGTGFTLDDMATEASELGLLDQGGLDETVALLRRDGLLEGNFVSPVVGAPVKRLLESLDEAYPAMPGLVLSAYLVQLLQELLQGRNDFEKACEQVDQALGIRDESEVLDEDPAVAAERRERILKRLSDIRKNLVERTGRNIQVKEILPAGAKSQVKSLVVSASEEAAPKEMPAPEPEPVAAPAPEKKSAEAEAAQREAFLALQREKMELEKEREALRAEKRRLEAEKVSQKAWESSEESAEGDEASTPMGESDEEIAAAIARFQENLSLKCPVCGAGDLHTHQTDNGKEFYRCDDRSCGFVTWKKPYPFACPICKNGFLVENDAGDGLVCPKSVCSYKQEGLMAPSEAPAPKKEKAEGTRKVRRVRRVVRKRK